MDTERLLELLNQIKGGGLEPEEALRKLKHLPYEDLGYAKLDHHRALRLGFPEVVMAMGKTADQVATIAERLAQQSDPVLITRANPEQYQAVAARVEGAQYYSIPQAIVVSRKPLRPTVSGVFVLSGGTADMPVAEEAALTAELMECAVERIYDVGIAGLHRLLAHLPKLQAAKVVVAVAGMEGALPGIVAGMLAVPVIAVPTSIGYGANFGGLAPLLTMLNSCAAGVAVVNIDNGFGAGFLAALIARRWE